jgi:hypothetical protein
MFRLEHLRIANVYRQAESKQKLALTVLADELAGEASELRNTVQKAEREHDTRVTVDEIAAKIASVIITADLIAARLNINLGEAIVTEFNRISRGGTQLEPQFECGVVRIADGESRHASASD